MILTVLSAIALSVTLPYWCGVEDTGPYNEAVQTYAAGLAHDPANRELGIAALRAVDAFEKSARGVEGNERL